MTGKTRIVELQKTEDGELYLPLDDDIWNELGWQIGDTVEWIDNGNGSWTIRRKDN